jgi:hypothetical protein
MKNLPTYDDFVNESRDIKYPSSAGLKRFYNKLLQSKGYSARALKWGIEIVEVTNKTKKPNFEVKRYGDCEMFGPGLTLEGWLRMVINGEHPDVLFIQVNEMEKWQGEWETKELRDTLIVDYATETIIEFEKTGKLNIRGTL